MAALADVQHFGVVEFRPAVLPLQGLLGKARKDIDLGQNAAVGLDGGNLLLDLADKRRIQLRLNGIDAILRREDFLLVLLEFLGDVPFRIHQRLLANPLRRHLVLVGVAHLNVIAKNVVVGNFQGRYARALRLPLLHLQEVVLAAGAQGAELVQFRIYAGADDRALPHLHGGFRGHHAPDFLQEFLAVAQALELLGQGLGALQPFPDGAGQCQAAAQLHHLPREGFSRGNAAQDALHVPQLAQVHLRIVQNLRIFREVLHTVIAGLQLLPVQDGHGQPGTQQTGAHGAGALVQGLHQRDAVRPRSALEHLQIAEGEAVHPHKLGLVYAADAANVLEAGVLCLFQVHE